jgi:hypothetical protein
MQFKIPRTSRATIPEILTLVGSRSHAARWLLGVIFCRRSETLLAIFEEDKVYKTSEGDITGSVSIPWPILGADQVSRKPGIWRFCLAQDKRRPLFDFSHSPKRIHSTWPTHS